MCSDPDFNCNNYSHLYSLHFAMVGVVVVCFFVLFVVVVGFYYNFITLHSAICYFCCSCCLLLFCVLGAVLLESHFLLYMA